MTDKDKNKIKCSKCQVILKLNEEQKKLVEYLNARFREASKITPTLLLCKKCSPTSRLWIGFSRKFDAEQELLLQRITPLIEDYERKIIKELIAVGDKISKNIDKSANKVSSSVEKILDYLEQNKVTIKFRKVSKEWLYSQLYGTEINILEEVGE